MQKAEVFVEQYLVLEAGLEAQRHVGAVRDDHQTLAVDGDVVIFAPWQALFVVNGVFPI